MDKIVGKVISDAVQGSCLYSYRDSTWLVFPDKKEWIISLFDKNGYLWYNHDFFRNLFLYLDMGLGDNNPHVKRWVQDGLGLMVGDNCHPDYLPGEYDWRGDFDVHEVIREGVRILSEDKFYPTDGNSLRSRESQPFFES